MIAVMKNFHLTILPNMKIIKLFNLRSIFLLFIFMWPALSWSQNIIIGKNQAPINKHDYESLKKLAENAQVPIEEFRHYKDRNHYIVDGNGLIYLDKKKNGIIDGDDNHVTGPVALVRKGYITDHKGAITVLNVGNTMFNDTRMLNAFRSLKAIYLSTNKIVDINIKDLSELRSLVIFRKGDNPVVVSAFRNLNKLAYLNINGLFLESFENMKGLDSLYQAELRQLGLSSFKGLDNMPNLKHLEVTMSKGPDDNLLANLDNIPKNHGLERFKLSSAYTTDISGIANLPSLKRLELWNSNKKLNDLTPLNKLKNLEELEVTAFALKDFTFLDGMPKLKSITTYHAPITSLSGLHEAPNLQELKLYSGKLDQISGLDGNPELKTIYFNNHNISKLEGLDKLKKLNTLDVSRNHIAKIENLKHNQCLEKLWLNSNPVKKLENLGHLPILRELGLERTKIKKLDGWKELDRLGKISIDPSQLEIEKSNSRYFYRYIPIKEIDMKLKQSEPITQEEYKQYGCI